MIKFRVTESTNPEIEAAKLRMIKRLSIVFAVVFSSMSIIFWDEEFYAWLGYFLAFVISGIVLIYLFLIKQHKHVFIFYSVSGSVLANIACSLSLTTPHYVDFLWMILCSFIAFIGFGKRLGVFILGLNAIGMGIFVFYSLNTHIEVLKPFTTDQLMGAYAEILLAVLILATMLYEFMRYQEIAMNSVSSMNTVLSEKNKVIEEKNTENITLLKEVHHRVKNNLQIIVSLLRLQIADKNNPEAERYFEEAINRIMSMALIHEKLYQQDDISQIKIENYIDDLASELDKVYGRELSINYEIHSDFDGLNLKTVVPVGLIVNELISNSLKHGFSSGNNGEIEILFNNNSDGSFNLNYKDNGKGLSADLPKGFGSELIDLLTEQLNGTCETRNTGNGVNYLFQLNRI